MEDKYKDTVEDDNLEHEREDYGSEEEEIQDK